MDYLSFYRSAWRRLMQVTRPGDLLVAKTDPPLISLVATAAAKRKRAGLLNWLQDIYPEVAVQLDVPFLRGPIAATLAKLRNRSLLAAEVNVVVGELMGRTLEALGVPLTAVRVIPNWCDDLEIRPLTDVENPLRQAWGLQGKFVFGYSGNLGRVHESGTVLSAAELLRNDPRIIFLVIGGGKKFGELQSAVEQRALAAAFRFMPYQKRELLASSLGVPDVHWLSLDPKYEGLIVPSKFYGVAAAGKPIVFIGDESGEHARLIRKYGCGVVIRPGDAAELARTLLQMADHPEVVGTIGARARQMLDAHFTRRQSFERWGALLDQLDHGLDRPRIELSST